MRPISSVSPEKSAVANDIEMADARMIYENPAEYAAWRKRMHLDKDLEPAGNPMMRARLMRLFGELGASLAPPRQGRRRDFQPPEELREDYAENPVTMSAELSALVSRGTEERRNGTI